MQNKIEEYQYTIRRLCVGILILLAGFVYQIYLGSKKETIIKNISCTENVNEKQCIEILKCLNEENFTLQKCKNLSGVLEEI